ncbi:MULTISPECIES: YdcK family protein [Klebsiella]|uniref:Bifunctional protein GlmU n=1 Tax=Klebsiella huaxiensis TaxID=2153354 RepID=A0A564KYP9_9ENTR|nr:MULTISPECIES: YdcK family protein [Klebsiella]VUS74426.1 Bifunctional protein GlmU [Klebsiella huaxiensis]
MRKYCLSEKVRQFHYEEDGNKHSVNLRQIVALRDFSDVKVGDEGGWLDDEEALSHSGGCWIYDANSAVFDGSRIEGNARLTGECVIGHGVIISDNARLDSVHISHYARVSDNVTIESSRIRGCCHLADDARILPHSLIIAAQGLTADNDKILRIYQRATVSTSRIVHQAQIYGDAFVEYAFVEHRAEIFDNARLEGNNENDVWVCDNARVYGNARIIAGREEDAIPTLRYSSQVAENAIVEGNCLLKHRVMVGGHAHLRGGPILLDDEVLIEGNAAICGDVIIEHQVAIRDGARVEASAGDAIHIRGAKVISGDEHITRTPIVGFL